MTISVACLVTYSAVQEMVQGEPCLNTSFGPGPVGTSWAVERKGRTRRNERMAKANMATLEV